MNDILNFNEYNKLFISINKQCSWKVGLKKRIYNVISKDYSQNTKKVEMQLMNIYKDKSNKLSNHDIIHYLMLKESNLLYLDNVIKDCERKEKKRKTITNNLYFIGLPFFRLLFDYRDSKLPYYYKIRKEIIDFQPLIIAKEEIKKHSFKDTIALMCETGMMEAYIDSMLKRGFSLNSSTVLLAGYLGSTRNTLYPLLYAYSKGPTAVNYPIMSEDLKRKLNIHMNKD